MVNQSMVPSGKEIFLTVEDVARINEAGEVLKPLAGNPIVSRETVLILLRTTIEQSIEHTILLELSSRLDRS